MKLSDQRRVQSPESEVTAVEIPSLASGSRLKAAFRSDAPRPAPGPPDPKLPIGTSERLGPYQLVSELASGGMAKIYLAIRVGSEGFRRVVAIKRLHDSLYREPSHVDMFVDEANLSSLVDHPSVRQILDFGYAGGTFYMVMEFLNGEPLSAVYDAWVIDNPPPRPAGHARVVARVVADLCSGLHAIHQLEDVAGNRLDVVHRDVSPQNLFVLHDGSTRVTDLGIAYALGRRQRTTGRRLKGKLAYMSPEYLGHQAYDLRTDVWSIGVVLWELLAGKRLFRRANVALTAQAVSSDEIPALSSDDREIDPELASIVRRALSRDPRGRHESALALGQELERYLARTSPVGRAEVSAWLDTLLPSSREKLRELVRLARTTPLAAGAPSSFPAPREASRARIAPLIVLLALTLVGLALLCAYCLAR